MTATLQLISIAQQATLCDWRMQNSHLFVADTDSVVEDSNVEFLRITKAVFTLGPVLFRILATRTRRVDLASDLHSHYKRLTRRERYAPTSPCTHCVCFVTVVTQLHVLNSWHMSPFRVMWIVSVEINRSVCRHAQTVRRSLPDAPDASTRAFTLQSQADAYRSRPLRTHPDVVWVYRSNPTQWTQCVHGQPDANRSRTVPASGKIASVYTA